MNTAPLRWGSLSGLRRAAPRPSVRWLRTHSISRVPLKDFHRQPRILPYQLSMARYRRRMDSRVKQAKYWVTFAVFAGLVAFYTMWREVVPITARQNGMLVLTPPELRRKFQLVPVAFDNWVGDWAFQKEVDSHHLIPRDDPACTRVIAIVDTLLQGLERLVPNHQLHSCRVVVVSSDDLNASCHPGCNIVVSANLVARVSSDSHLALILAHEIAHALARHGTEGLIWNGLMTMLSSLFWPRPLVSPWMTFLQIPYTRAQEAEADTIGLHLALAAGYAITPGIITETYRYSTDPVQPSPQPPDTYLSDPEQHWFYYLTEQFSSHPLPERRIESLIEALPIAQRAVLAIA